jgi:hypothetical protein
MMPRQELASKGWRPDGSVLLALLEGAVAGDDPRDCVSAYDIAAGALGPAFHGAPDALSQTVDLRARGRLQPP